MIFPQPLIDETKRQTGRDLTRFDLDYDLPQHVLPEFPAPIYLTTRPDLGDVSKGQLVTVANYYDLFKDHGFLFHKRKLRCLSQVSARSKISPSLAICRGQSGKPG